MPDGSHDNTAVDPCGNAKYHPARQAQPDDRRAVRAGSVQAARRTAETAPAGQEGNMTTHFNGDCPAMKPGDEIADAENLAVEGWAYDCMTCRYTEQRIHRAWEGGFLNALQLALYRLEEIQTARELGRSKLQVFRLLVNDWRDRETVWSPEFLPLMIMTGEEILAYSCPACERGMSYSRTENDVAVWACDVCGREMRMMTGSEGF